jgi:hypothetical protein
MENTEQNKIWKPVKQSELGFALRGKPDEIVTGPDGRTYRIGGPLAAAEQAQNPQAVHAVPTPSTVVQMPAIVQPIALVPYATQNQPMLQYDPYAKPVEPKVVPPEPQYFRKPYRGLSIVAIILACAAIVALFLPLFSVASFNSPEYKLTGILAITNLFGGKDTGVDFFDGSFFAIIIPIIVIITAVLFLALVVYYIIRIAKNLTARNFSHFALANIILNVLAIGLLLWLSVDNTDAFKTEYIKNFFVGGETADGAKIALECGFSLLISLILSVVLFVLPFFAHKSKFLLNTRNGGHSASYIIK